MRRIGAKKGRRPGRRRPRKNALATPRLSTSLADPSIVVPIQAHHPTIVHATDLAVQAIGHAHLIAKAAVVLVGPVLVRRLLVGEAVNATVRVGQALVAEAMTVLIGQDLVAEAAVAHVGRALVTDAAVTLVGPGLVTDAAVTLDGPALATDAAVALIGPALIRRCHLVWCLVVLSEAVVILKRAPAAMIRLIFAHHPLLCQLK